MAIIFQLKSMMTKWFLEKKISKTKISALYGCWFLLYMQLYIGLLKRNFRRSLIWKNQAPPFCVLCPKNFFEIIFWKLCIFFAIFDVRWGKQFPRTLKIEYTAHRHITCNPSRKVGAPRASERKGARNTYTLLFVGRQKGDDGYRVQWYFRNSRSVHKEGARVKFPWSR